MQSRIFGTYIDDLTTQQLAALWDSNVYIGVLWVCDGCAVKARPREAVCVGCSAVYDLCIDCTHCKTCK